MPLCGSVQTDNNIDTKPNAQINPSAVPHAGAGHSYSKDVSQLKGREEEATSKCNLPTLSLILYIIIEYLINLDVETKNSLLRLVKLLPFPTLS